MLVFQTITPPDCSPAASRFPSGDQAGDWRTLETFWNTSATGYFYFPAGAQIKVRYGVGWLGYDSDKQTLDGLSTKVLRVGGASVVRARMQMKFGRSLYVNYTICQ